MRHSLRLCVKLSLNITDANLLSIACVIKFQCHCNVIFKYDLGQIEN